MRITLNLASKPFIELRPLYTRLRWWMMLLLLAAIPIWLLLKMEQRKAAVVNARLQSVETSIQRLENQQRSYQAMMRQPQNAAVLTQADFLNGLFARKSFSWTAILMDLETVLPGGVQVMNIDPTTDKNGTVTIRLRVNGERDRAVALIRNLEHSRRFLQPRLASESLETSSDGGNPNLQPASVASSVNFDVLAEYNPLPPSQTMTAGKSEAKGGTEQRSGKPEKPVESPARSFDVRPGKTPVRHGSSTVNAPAGGAR